MDLSSLQPQMQSKKMCKLVCLVFITLAYAIQGTNS